MSDNTEELKVEEHIPFDPKEIEAQLVKMAQERAEDPVETAASCYKIYAPYFKAQLPKLSTRALRRVLEFIILYPLEKDSPGHTSELEREMMELSNTLAQAKFVMLLGHFNEHAEEFHNAATTPLTVEEEAQVIADLKAGGASDEDIIAIHNNVDKLEQGAV